MDEVLVIDTVHAVEPASVMVPVYVVTLDPVVRLPPLSPNTEYESHSNAVPSYTLVPLSAMTMTGRAFSTRVNVPVNAWLTPLST